MSLSLKDQNRPLLALVVLANAALYFVVLSGELSIENWIGTFTDIQNLAPVLVVSILTGILNGQVSHEYKARLVFWNWKHPLPGSRAFTEYIQKDPRIDVEKLKAFADPLPEAPEKQNALWFKWYREFQNEPGIKQVHREYLFTRDYAGISFLSVVGLGALAFWQFEEPKIALMYLVILLLQYFFVRRAARNHGSRFVSSVLAYKASES